MSGPATPSGDVAAVHTSATAERSRPDARVEYLRTQLDQVLEVLKASQQRAARAEALNRELRAELIEVGLTRDHWYTEAQTEKLRSREAAQLVRELRVQLVGVKLERDGLLDEAAVARGEEVSP